MQQQQFDQAIQTAKQLPQVYEKYLLLGAAYMNKNAYKPANKWLTEGINLYPDSLKLTILKIEVLFYQADYKQFLNLYKATSNQMVMSNDLNRDLNILKPKVAFAYQKLAQQAVTEKRYVYASQCYDNALQYEQSIQSYIGISLALLEQEKWAELITYASNGLEIYPDQPDLLGLLANAYYKIEQYKDLQEIYELIYSNDDENLEKALTLGEVMVVNQDYQAAQKHYDLLLTKHAENEAVYDAALNIAAQFRNLESRIAILKRKNQFIPSSETTLELAEAYQLANQRPRAIALYDSLISVSANNSVYKKGLVKVFERADSLPAILDKLEKYAADYPTEAYFQIAMSELARSLDCNEAISFAEKFIKVNSVEINTNIAFIHNSCGDRVKSVNELQNILIDNKGATSASVLLAELSISFDSLTDKRANYLSAAANNLLHDITELKEQLNSLTLSNPFSSIWLEVPQMTKKLEQRESELTSIINLASQNLSLTETADMLESLKKKHSNNARLHFLSGQHYAFHREKELAKKHYETAIRIEPDLLDAQYEWAKLSERSKDMQKAIVGYEKTLAINDQYKKAYDGLIRIYRSKNELETLSNRWEMIYQNNAHNDVLKEALIEVLHKQGKMDAAKELINNE